ncbi:MAG: cation:proton antiporter [Ignavibacteriae bacterium]|nr:cation:proton antiporter [Ignavibacteriota bacterium]|tara:strand:+ start:320 stop:586 length:267 start_codon:yes stop_codon:yes gene_type:complete
MTFFETTAYISLVAISVGILFIFIRLLKGPSLADRIVALDLLTAAGIGFISILSFLYDKPVLLDAAVILALLAFLTTVAFAFYLERKK